MGYILLIAVGVVLSILGILNIRGNITTMHWYHRTKVTEADVPKYGKWMGMGTLAIGVSCLITAVLQMLFDWEPLAYTIIVGIVVGLAMMLYGQIKYNRGLF